MDKSAAGREDLGLEDLAARKIPLSSATDLAVFLRRTSTLVAVNSGHILGFIDPTRSFFVLDH